MWARVRALPPATLWAYNSTSKSAASFTGGTRTHATHAARPLDPARLRPPGPGCDLERRGRSRRHRAGVPRGIHVRPRWPDLLRALPDRRDPYLRSGDRRGHPLLHAGRGDHVGPPRAGPGARLSRVPVRLRVRVPRPGRRPARPARPHQGRGRHGDPGPRALSDRRRHRTLRRPDAVRDRRHALPHGGRWRRPGRVPGPRLHQREAAPDDPHRQTGTRQPVRQQPGLGVRPAELAGDRLRPATRASCGRRRTGRSATTR